MLKEETEEDVDFVPVILGGDITAYSLARSFHEEYGIKSVAVSMLKSVMISYSSIIENIVETDMDNGENFVRRLVEIAGRYPKRKRLLLACGDWYVRLIAENRDELESYYIIPYIGEELLNRLVLKNSFYDICEEIGVPYPETFVYDCSDPKPLDFKFSYPVIAKPASSAAYHYADFRGKKKVFCLETEAELSAMLKNLSESSYDYKFLIQDRIPGPDDNMRILTCYCDRFGKVRFFSSGHVLMEENTDMGIGNPVAIINDINTEIMENAKRLLEYVGYKGFANFDIKYDERDHSYRFFEINTRLGRSNYYVTGSGFNAVKWIVDDLIYEKDFDGETIVADNEDSLYTVVPKKVLTDNVKDEKLKKRISDLWNKGCVHNPIDYSGDKNLMHRLYPIYFARKQKKKFKRQGL
ncbi:MAG: hypothetical protein HFE90_08840 [Firmicutes bacterium]|nr:hypothetical protein [Bacillota bacterium]